MITFNWNPKLYRALKANVPEGHAVFTVRRGRKIQIKIRHDEPDYFAPWYGLGELLSEFGFDSRYYEQF